MNWRGASLLNSKKPGPVASVLGAGVVPLKIDPIMVLIPHFVKDIYNIERIDNNTSVAIIEYIGLTLVEVLIVSNLSEIMLSGRIGMKAHINRIKTVSKAVKWCENKVAIRTGMIRNGCFL
ncbi:hypothetical protein [Haloterrigena alkaliphila]|uniref:Uncharacterized protein n=1 Tax=Haloterrigena alkaliphila TaxID=2816475 RepID=A0A8A2V8D3_9EURY|nr:hypothetical protein [Haloterrigena alkaliphila]QSW98229.1 hypothetical protein J0X25_12545 [Haloterrigena alkaliphila]